MKLDFELGETRSGADEACILAAASTSAELDLIIARPEFLPGALHSRRQAHRPHLIQGEPRFDYRRVLDILASLGLIALLAPVMLLVALMIFLSDGGPPIFLHRRVGRNGKIFPCLKFRSMCINAEAQLKQYLVANHSLRHEWQNDQKLDDDPRVTALGKFLRVSSIDELPQLFNVLWGDMTLVGPRPIVTDELPRYGRYASHYLSVKPGLTGLWQVSGRSLTSYRRRVAIDVLYVRSRSFSLDVHILLNTIPAVLKGDGSC
jgi:exopolysaccharide production protein ExoY